MVKVALEDVSEELEEVQFEVTLKVYVVFELRPVMVYGLLTSETVVAIPSESVYSKSKLSEPAPGVLSCHVTVALSFVVAVVDSESAGKQAPSAAQNPVNVAVVE